MKLETQVVNKELSKKLKKLKVKQDSLWYYLITKEGIRISQRERIEIEVALTDPIIGEEVYSAFTVAESMEGLPTYLEGGNWDLTIQKTDVGYIVSYQNGYGECYKGESSCSPSLANTLAKMRIYLIENKLMEAK